MNPEDPLDPDRLDALERRLAALHADASPPPDWEARVWARIAREEDRARSPSRWRWLAAALPLGAAAVAGLFVYLRGASTVQPVEPGLEIAIHQGGERVRGRAPAAGDVLVVRAGTGGAARAEVRVYRGDGELVARCGDGPGCRREGDLVEARVELPSPGEYRGLLLFSAEPIPPPAGSLDADVAAARAAGARFELSPPVVVH